MELIPEFSHLRTLSEQRSSTENLDISASGSSTANYQDFDREREGLFFLLRLRLAGLLGLPLRLLGLRLCLLALRLRLFFDLRSRLLLLLGVLLRLRLRPRLPLREFLLRRLPLRLREAFLLLSVLVRSGRPYLAC